MTAPTIDDPASELMYQTGTELGSIEVTGPNGFFTVIGRAWETSDRDAAMTDLRILIASLVRAYPETLPSQ
ncbi:hypothetical protein [Nocardia flavorosea]|uniref:Uncharacterized protein n=1 Tax=Nocardia flavorosea TaxID=53429 RepID=A0A846YS71_9NOCA|nr:hypothetical protein [Nocardia flavorosea]NKY60400.1 hypothetical protein [Nocardia flavorosea]